MAVQFLNEDVRQEQTNAELISCMFYEVDVRKKLASPLFYLKVLFNR